MRIIAGQLRGRPLLAPPAPPRAPPPTGARSPFLHARQRLGTFEDLRRRGPVRGKRRAGVRGSIARCRGSGLRRNRFQGAGRNQGERREARLDRQGPRPRRLRPCPPAKRPVRPDSGRSPLRRRLRFGRRQSRDGCGMARPGGWLSVETERPTPSTPAISRPRSTVNSERQDYASASTVVSALPGALRCSLISSNSVAIRRRPPLPRPCPRL